MPLSSPAPRTPLHDRQVHCAGFRREDGGYDIEGHLVDTKHYGFENRYRGRIEPGTPIHEMWLRLSLDESLLILAVEAVTDHSPYPMCPDITPNFQRIVGLRIGRGFRREVAQRVGGTEGCTHLQELLGPMATTAFQTLAGHRHEVRKRDPQQRPHWLGTCHAHATDSVVIKELYPQFYSGK